MHSVTKKKKKNQEEGGGGGKKKLLILNLLQLFKIFYIAFLSIRTCDAFSLLSSFKPLRTGAMSQCLSAGPDFFFFFFFHPGRMMENVGEEFRMSS